MFTRETAVLFMAALRCHNVCKVLTCSCRRAQDRELTAVLLSGVRDDEQRRQSDFHLVLSMTYCQGKMCIVMKLYRESMLSRMRR